MDVDMKIAYDLLKLRLGITSEAMAQRLSHLLEATVKMLDDEKGIQVDLTNPLMLEFVVSYSAWLYERKADAGMPRYLQLQLHNLFLHNKKVRLDEEVV